MPPRALPFLLPLLLAAACSQPVRREPIPGRTGEPTRTTTRVPPPPAEEPEDPRELDRATEALLERLLVEQPSAEAHVPAPEGYPDLRPLAALAVWELGEGPFTVAGRVVPPSALRYALAVSLERRFAAGGPLRGPVLVEQEETGEGEPPPAAPALAETPPADLTTRARELGARYLLHGRLERLDQQRTTVYLSHSRRYLASERAALAFRYRLHDLERGHVACENDFVRTFELDGLPPDELASAEWVLAWEAARLVREDLEACLSGSEAEADEE